MSEVPEELIVLRGAIDNMDAALIHLLAERFRITREVGRLKAERGLSPADPAREAEQIARLRQLAVESNLDPEFAQKVVRHHEAIADESQDDPASTPEADASTSEAFGN